MFILILFFWWKKANLPSLIYMGVFVKLIGRWCNTFIPVGVTSHRVFGTHKLWISLIQRISHPNLM